MKCRSVYSRLWAG